ncbi:hypothetical protein SDC9_81481 [bioreactor metagenome]|uniref:Uncharacterized protein n=1 Tax=bioreactor metagenome TaxID=1076179 RepID=A0A644Z4G9_9ZZZZ
MPGRQRLLHHPAAIADFDGNQAERKSVTEPFGEADGYEQRQRLHHLQKAGAARLPHARTARGRRTLHHAETHTKRTSNPSENGAGHRKQILLADGRRVRRTA